MADWNPTANAIFLNALDLSSPEERRAYLDRTCADNPELRAYVESLLSAHEDAGSFLGGLAAEKLPADAETRGECTQALGDSPCAGEPSDSPPENVVEPLDGAAGGNNVLAFLAPSLKPGALGRLGHYEVLEVVGHGGMGTVFKAFDDKLHRVVAIKVMAAELAAAAAARKRFIREARAAAAVTHEHVVTIHAVEEEHRPPYLVMQLIEGMSLQEKLDRDGPLGVKQILQIGGQTAAGLAAAHKQGLVHRDIKPANILLENGVERVKITDFGLARAVDDASLSQSGVIAGTPIYMAPEQAEGRPVDHRADLFSLGSVIYAMCTGHPPFRAGTTMGVLRRVCDEVPRPIRQINPEIPDYLAAIVEKLHAKEPAARFQSAFEVAELLSQHLTDVQQPALTPAPGPATPPRRPRGVVAGLMLLVLAGGLGLLEVTGVTRLFRPDRPTPRVRENNPLPPPPSTPSAVEKESANSAGMRLRLIPAGEFVMGSPKTEVGHTDEEYPHRVRITRPFYLGVYEVTQEEYRRVTGGNPSWFSPTGGGRDRVAGVETGRLPVDSVSWDDAVAFCRALSELPAERGAERTYRLPTEAEWEYACRAGTNTVFHFGDSLSPAQAIFDGRSPYGSAERGPFLRRTAPVGSHAPNAWGLYDMHGNVWEWCQDGYAVDYYRKSPVENPQLREAGDLRVLRGGSWYSTGAACRAAFRHKQTPDSGNYCVGFRVLCVPR